MKAVRSRSSRSLVHEAAYGCVHERATDSLKIKGAHEDTYRLSSNYLIWSRQRKKIGQNRFHDLAPQTRVFLTSNYYAVKRPLSIPLVFGCTRIDRERRYPRCWKEGLPEPSLEDPRDEVVRRGYYGVARVPVAVQSCRPAPCLAVSPF